MQAVSVLGRIVNVGRLGGMIAPKKWGVGVSPLVRVSALSAMSFQSGN
jgi:hypothetical protein